MSLYAIGDFHLSFLVDKPMEVFDSVWQDGFFSEKPSIISRLCLPRSMKLNGSFPNDKENGFVMHALLYNFLQLIFYFTFHSN